MSVYGARTDVDFTASEYADNYLKSSMFMKRFWALRYLRNIGKFVKSGDKRLLDIGCATGELMKAAKKFYGYSCIGLDVNPELSGIARSSGLAVYVARLEDIKFQDKSFDVIVCLSVIQYIDEKEKFLADVKRVMKDDGVFLIHSPKPFFTAEELRSLLECNGFKILFARVKSGYAEYICGKNDV